MLLRIMIFKKRMNWINETVTSLKGIKFLDFGSNSPGSFHNTLADNGVFK